MYDPVFLLLSTLLTFFMGSKIRINSAANTILCLRSVFSNRCFNSSLYLSNAVTLDKNSMAHAIKHVENYENFVSSWTERLRNAFFTSEYIKNMHIYFILFSLCVITKQVNYRFFVLIIITIKFSQPKSMYDRALLVCEIILGVDKKKMSHV